MVEQQKQENTLKNIIAVTYITKHNSVFKKVRDFITLDLTLPSEETGENETKHYDRIFLHRAFPFDHPWSYISVLDADSKEIGIISKIDDFGKETETLLRDELERKYFAPRIEKILSVKERYGFSYWKVITDSGELSFALHDTYRSLLKIGGTRVFILDIDGNRFEIPDVEQLDRKSFKKIELYL